MFRWPFLSFTVGAGRSVFVDFAHTRIPIIFVYFEPLVGESSIFSIFRANRSTASAHLFFNDFKSDFRNNDAYE